MIQHAEHVRLLVPRRVRISCATKYRHTYSTICSSRAWSGHRQRESRGIDHPPDPSAQRGPGPAHRSQRREPQVPGSARQPARPPGRDRDRLLTHLAGELVQTGDDAEMAGPEATGAGPRRTARPSRQPRQDRYGRGGDNRRLRGVGFRARPRRRRPRRHHVLELREPPRLPQPHRIRLHRLRLHHPRHPLARYPGR